MVSNRDYYYANGEQVPLVKETEVYAVKFKPGRTSRDPSFSRSAYRFLREDSEPISFIPHYGLHIYQTRNRQARTNGAFFQELVRSLAQETAVDFASIAYRRSRSEEADCLFVTNRFIVQFQPQVTPDQIDHFNTQHGVKIVEALNYVDNGYLLEAPAAEGEASALNLANLYYNSDLTIFAHPDYIWRRHTRSLVTAPRTVATERSVYLSQQWHLRTAKVTDAWNTTKGSPQITIAILDDGVDPSHPEFTGKIASEYDFASHTANGSPKRSTDNHGTACAGVAVASGTKAYGAAPNCKLMAVRTPDFLGVADEANMFRWVADNGADVISCSWGPQDGTGALDPLPDNVRAALHYCVTSGRNGKGIPILWAAGNGNELVSRDGYAANPEVIAVAASTSRETHAWYSDFGPEIWVSAPSSGDSSLGEQRIFTTDRRGAAGYNSGSVSEGDSAGDYTNDFGGTSSSTPLVAGIVGLMLSVNPNLTNTQVKTLLKKTADQIGSSSDYDGNGHSQLFGYGRVNADKAVAEAHNPQPDTTNPSIQAPERLSRNGEAPSFTVNTGGRRLFAVEVATQSRLFDANNHQSERNESNFYGSWQDTALLSSSPYVLPATVWTKLKGANQLYYRAHVADTASWENYGVTTSDNQASNAPLIQIFEETTPNPINQLSIQAPEKLSRNGVAPSFTVSTGGRRLFAVEVATQSRLFDANNHQSDRNESNFYGSWQDTALLSSSPYVLPATVWTRLKGANQLYYRAHVADTASWENYGVTTSDNEASDAPLIQITGHETPPTQGRTITYPSGAVFAVVDSPQDDIDYNDPVAGGEIPLIEVASRLEENLSHNFKVKELAARKLTNRSQYARYARISPELVAALQKLRERVGVAIKVNSAYRYPALNQSVGGVAQSQHLVGRAADIRCSGISPLELARLALEEIGCNIGIGLGQNSIHLDLRGNLASWTYEGAAMNEAEFDSWVRNFCTQLNRRSDHNHEVRRREFSLRQAPVITAPETYNANGESPSFLIMPGQNSFYAVEVTTDWQLFVGGNRQPSNFFASWQQGLSQAQGETTIYLLPDFAWQQLSHAPRLFYRILTTSANSPEWLDFATSCPNDLAKEAPYLDLVGGRGERSRSTMLRLGIANSSSIRLADEALWRGRGQRL